MTLTPGQKLIAAYHGGEIGDFPDLARAIDEAIAQERETCARTCDQEAEAQQAKADACMNILAAAEARCARSLASAIRARVASPEAVREGAANDG